MNAKAFRDSKAKNQPRTWQNVGDLVVPAIGETPLTRQDVEDVGTHQRYMQRTLAMCRR